MKIFIGSLVGGIIIFICQFLSWGVLNPHCQAQQYTPKQDSILAYLNTQFDSSGGYLCLMYLKALHQKIWKLQNEKAMGKPWAQVYYHKS